MNNENNGLHTDPQKVPKDIDQLHSKYDNLSEKVKQLELNTTTIGADLKQINTNIDEILLKLNKLSDKYEEIEQEKAEENPIARSMKKIFTNPLRKIAVGTLSAVYAVADKTIEETSNFRESLEDIVAEAQYLNKKKKIPPVQNE